MKNDVYMRNIGYFLHSFGQSARHLVKGAQFLKSIQAYNAVVADSGYRTASLVYNL